MHGKQDSYHERADFGVPRLLGPAQQPQHRVIKQQATQCVQAHRQQVKRKRLYPEDSDNDGEHREGQRPVASAGHNVRPFFRLVVSEKCVRCENLRNPSESLLRKDVLGYGAPVILSPLMAQCVRIKQKSNGNHQNTLESNIRQEPC